MMEIEIKTKKENEVLQRSEIEGDIAFKGATPSNKQLQEELAQKLGVGQELVAIRHIYTKFGTEKAKFQAVTYATKEQFQNIEPKKKTPKTAPGAAPAAPA